MNSKGKRLTQILPLKGLLEESHVFSFSFGLIKIDERTVLRSRNRIEGIVVLPGDYGDAILLQLLLHRDCVAGGIPGRIRQVLGLNGIANENQSGVQVVSVVLEVAF